MDLGKRVPRADEAARTDRANCVPGTIWRWHDKSRGLAINELGQLGTFPTHGSLPAPQKRDPS